MVGLWAFIVACLEELILRREHKSKCSLRISLIGRYVKSSVWIVIPFVTLFFNLCSCLFSELSVQAIVLKCLPIPCIETTFCVTEVCETKFIVY